MAPRHEKEKGVGYFCPKCGERVITIYDDPHRKMIKRCSKCSYRKEKDLEERREP